MRTHDIGRDMICAGGAVLLTSLSCIVFLLGEPRALAMSTTAHASSPAPSESGPSGPGLSKVDRGRYLVKIGGCNDCHTPGYSLKAGKLDESQWLVGSRLGFQGPWGTTYPANLRLFVRNLTVEQWLQIARQPMRPPMPWFALRDMTDEDLAAIYTYIRSLGPAGTAALPYAPPGKVVQTQVVKMPGN